ncbi:Uncharacterized protein SAPIO_CDS6154 [Scedosporium apiospermum]|uniref:Major facilitator superfamily (MFS) profile domain-containing protein n=1 Tax=Pseudallescheria apiosperma TaxID=563466 RepID=A0A084G4M9_PSEDA|nr:Uncharacterized protein SAPIO_CDS6154 [Scedosporium apiospermum]KEZ42291.1 Uncharacterized protein SAPIO_CDS6154 [Scedosporium apiospermum]
MPTFFQIVKGLSAAKSGVMVLPTGAGLILSVPLAGFLTSYFGYYNPFMILNSILSPLAAGLLTTMNPQTNLWRLLVYQALLGFGVGIGFQGPQVAVQTVLNDGDSQIGIAIIQLAQALGPAIFVAAAQTIFTSRLVSRLKGFSGCQGLAGLSDQGLTMPEGKDGDKCEAVLSYSKALAETFYLPVALASTKERNSVHE